MCRFCASSAPRPGQRGSPRHGTEDCPTEPSTQSRAALSAFAEWESLREQGSLRGDVPRNNYTTEVRILLCESCGAPLEVGADGGVVACSYCRVQNHVLRRNPEGFATPAKSLPVDENERLRRLRMQDGKPMVPPASLQSLMGPAGLADAKINEAFHVYQATRKEVVATHSAEAAERLYFLSLMLNTHLTTTKDDARRRALLETTLETVFLPRHIQVIRCMLATASAKERDLSSADKWLEPCDPRSDDIEADSSYRIAHAFVATVRGDFQKVLHMLGPQDEAYPFADAWDPTSAVLRANALERMGQHDAAVQALRDRMGREGFAGRAMMEKIINAHPEMALCPQSFQLAHQGHVKVAAKKAESSGGGMIGAIFYWVGPRATWQRLHRAGGRRTHLLLQSTGHPRRTNTR